MKPDPKHENKLYGRILRFCAYRERCSYEVKKKLRELGATPAQSKEILTILYEENFVNDRRFALSFTGDKFRLNRWGKNKIRMHIRAYQLPPELVTEALNSINDEEYLAVAFHLAQKKNEALNGLAGKEQRLKIFAYLHGRGFESDIIKEALEQLKKNQEGHED